MPHTEIATADTVTPTLDEQLSAIQATATQQTQAYTSSRQLLYAGLVDAYLWWRQARLTAGYLDDLYADKGIADKSLKNRPNFNSLIRVVWGTGPSKTVVANWAKSLLAVDEEYQKNQSVYAAQPRETLINFISDANGLSALRGGTDAADDKSEIETKPVAPSTAKVSKTRAGLLKLKQRQLAKFPARATINTQMPVVTDANNMLVMLARRAATGDLEIIGTTSDQTAINEALTASTELGISAVSPNLRAIAEAISLHALPRSLEKHRAKFFPKTKVKTTQQASQATGKAAKTQNTKQATQLRICANGDVLVSRSRTAVSVVSVLKPTHSFGVSQDMMLHGKDRYWIENELIAAGGLPLFEAVPATGLTVDTTDKSADYRIDLNYFEEPNKTARSLHFYTLDQPEDAIKQQANVTAGLPQDFDWDIVVDMAWLREFDLGGLGAWLEGLRGDFSKPRNARLRLAFAPEGVTIHYHYNQTKKNYAESKFIPFRNGNTFLFNENLAVIDCPAAETAIAFAALGELVLSDDTVTISGTSSILQISCTTDAGEHIIYIPAISADGVLDSSNFELYRS